MLSIDVPPAAYAPIAARDRWWRPSPAPVSGLVCAALALRVRETAVLANVVFGFLLVFCGANIPLDLLPGWMAAVSPWLPLTHGIEAARRARRRRGLGDVGGLLLKEAGVGAAFLVIGMLMLAYFEWESRRRATLETF